MERLLLPIPPLLTFVFLMAGKVIPDTIATGTEIPPGEIPGAEKPDCSNLTQSGLPRPRILLLGPTGKAYCNTNTKRMDKFIK